MSWLPAMMWMRMLDDDELEEQSSTGCNTGYTPLVDEIHPPVTDSTPTNNNNNNNNNAEDAPTVAPRTWHHTAMSAATFALSAIMGYIATEAICKRIRGHN